MKQMTGNMHITVNGVQADVLLKALDLYSRMATGQFQIIDEQTFLNDRTPVRYEEREHAIEQLRRLYFPELPKGAAYGIRGEESPEEAKIAYDIIQVMRHNIAWSEKPEGGIQINFQEPWQSAQTPLCQAKIEK